ncbi:DUF2835 domain-containing protein [Sulfuriflexus mobilis]|uniref:DUF2835 domain-containing protein n=1 Tax=Sulfuriflexus mobilis TaxID=1811807 RepID=UPI000F8316DE|nr:DUF2835 domain-containing protein [Sulfuriflexus mobilis]
MSENEYHFSLNLSAAEYMQYYQGSAQSVVVTTYQGLRVKFPASALRPYVSEGGVHGQFVLLTDANNKMRDLRRI